MSKNLFLVTDEQLELYRRVIEGIRDIDESNPIAWGSQWNAVTRASLESTLADLSEDILSQPPLRCKTCKWWEKSLDRKESGLCIPSFSRDVSAWPAIVLDHDEDCEPCGHVVLRTMSDFGCVEWEAK